MLHSWFVYLSSLCVSLSLCMYASVSLCLSVPCLCLCLCWFTSVVLYVDAFDASVFEHVLCHHLCVCVCVYVVSLMFDGGCIVVVLFVVCGLDVFVVCRIH